jgi:hypothetical protein
MRIRPDRIAFPATSRSAVTAGRAAVVAFGGRRVPRALRALPVLDGATGDAADLPGPFARLVVVGTDADLAAVLTRLLRTERLDVEVAHVTGRPGDARTALNAPAVRTPLIRDDTGVVIAGSARWTPPEGRTTLRGEAVVDDTVLFDGDVTGVLVEPLPTLPGLRATVLGGGLRPRRWVTGRAAQLGTTGALVLRDGVAGARPVRRSTFYRHTQGWSRVARR